MSLQWETHKTYIVVLKEQISTLDLLRSLSTMDCGATMAGLA